jgi:hypothetical protein
VRLDRAPTPDELDRWQRPWCARRGECLSLANGWRAFRCGTDDAPCMAYELPSHAELTASTAGLLALHHAALHPELDAHRGRRERSR